MGGEKNKAVIHQSWNLLFVVYCSSSECAYIIILSNCWRLKWKTLLKGIQVKMLLFRYVHMHEETLRKLCQVHFWNIPHILSRQLRQQPFCWWVRSESLLRRDPAAPPQRTVRGGIASRRAEVAAVADVDMSERAEERLLVDGRGIAWAVDTLFTLGNRRHRHYDFQILLCTCEGQYVLLRTLNTCTVDGFQAVGSSFGGRGTSTSSLCCSQAPCHNLQKGFRR